VNAVNDAADFNIKNVVAAFGPGAAFFTQRQPLADDQCHFLHLPSSRVVVV
jgi:hypothetical protein